jgi:AsmA protein
MCAFGEKVIALMARTRMRKWIITASVLLILVIATVVALFNVNAYIERNREFLIQEAEKALGRDITVGKVDVSIWPGIGFRLENFTLADDPKFSSRDFIRAKDLQVSLKLLPLLRKSVEVKKLILHDPAITVIRNRSGVYNFSTIGKNDKDRDASKQKDRVEKEPKGTPAFLIAVLDVTDGTVQYRDLGDGTDLRIQNLDLAVEDFDLKRPFKVKLAAGLFAAKQNVKIDTRLGPFSGDSDARKAVLDGVLSVDSLDLDQLNRALPKIKTGLPNDLRLGGVVSVKDLRLKGVVENLAFKGTVDGTKTSLDYGKMLHKPAGTSLELMLDGQYSNDRIVLRQTTSKFHNLKLRSKGEIGLGSRTPLNLSLDSDATSLNGWGEFVPVVKDYDPNGTATLNATVRRAATGGASTEIIGTLNLADVSAKPPQFSKPIRNLNSRMAFTGQQATISESSLQLGDTQLRLSGVVERFSPLALSYKLSTPEIRPADFQASLPADRQADVLKNLRSDGTVRIQNGRTNFQGKIFSGEGTLYGIGYQGLDTAVALAEKVLRIRNLKLNAFNGAIQAEGEYAFSDTPRFSLASQLNAIDLAELYRYLNAKNQSDLRGRLNGNLKITGQGNDWQAIKPNLRGSGHAEVFQGALLNVNIADAVSGATGIPGLTNLISPAVRKKYPETFEAKDTEFKELRTELEIADARINFKNLHMVAAQFTADGNGWANFDRAVDFRAAVKFSPALSNDIAGAVRELKFLFNKDSELEIPFTLAGTLPHVKPRPDSSYLAKAFQRGFFQRGTDELQRQFSGSKDNSSRQEPASGEAKERKKKPTEDLIRRGLEGLFGKQK